MLISKWSIQGRISGRVLDQNKEPVVGVSVSLVAREYSYGALRLVFGGQGGTDDQGEYVIERVQPGRAYALMAQKRSEPCRQCQTSRSIQRRDCRRWCRPIIRMHGASRPPSCSCCGRASEGRTPTFD